MLLSTFFRLDVFFFDLLSLFNRSDSLLLNYKKTDKESVDKFLQYDIYYHMDIKNFLLKQVSLYKYTWEVFVYMVITGKGYLGPNIWPKTSNQDTGSKDMIFTT